MSVQRPLVDPAVAPSNGPSNAATVAPDQDGAVPAARPAAPAAPAVVERSVGDWLRRTWLLGLANWQWLLLGGVFAALLLTRFWDLGSKAMHHDESMHAKYAWDTYRGQVYKYNPLLHGPFQFLVVAASFFLFGATEISARMVPATFGVGLVLLTFFWRRLLGNAGWLFAVLLLTFSPTLTYFFRMLREDSYTATWTLLAAVGLISYVYTRRREWFYACMAGLGLAFATKESTYITIFLFGIWVLAGLVFERWQRRASVAPALRVKAQAAGGHQPRPRGRPTTSLARRSRDIGSRPEEERPPAPEFQPVTAAARQLLRDQSGWWGMPVLWSGLLLFVLIYLLFFTSFFTHPRGWLGAWDGIQYWVAQHSVQRGNQPWYYYPMLLTAYETVAVVFGVLAVVCYLRRPTVFTTFLTWWFVGSLMIYSWAGEKMPWLVIHIVTPLLILAALYLGDVISDPERMGGGFRLFARGWSRMSQIALATAPASGAQLNQSTRTFSLILFSALFAWSVHTGWPVIFERPDVPQDPLVYTQTTPDVPKVVREIEDLSRRQLSDSKAIGITVTAGTWWPFSWYLRDFKNAEFPPQLNAPAGRPVVLVSADEDDANRPFLQGYTRTRYKMRWWYPEDYRLFRPQWFVDLLTRDDVRQATWKWLIYRETLNPLGSYDFFVYVREGVAATALAAPADTTTPQADVARAGQAAQQPAQGRPGEALRTPAAGALSGELAEAYAARHVPLLTVARWGSAGNGSAQFREPRAAATDARGNVYLADTLNHRIQKFDATGRLLIAWGTNGGGDGQFKEPMGIGVGPDGNVYVADTWNNRVQKFDPNGRFLGKWGTPNNAIGTRPGELYGPRALAFDASGTVFVMDTGNKRIQKFDPSGRLIGQLGGAGAAPGQLNEPIGIAVSPQGEVFVADRDNRRVQRLSADGQPILEWRVVGWQSGVRNEPYLALDAEGSLYATDPANHRLLKFSPDGELLAVAGGMGAGPNQLNAPTGVAVSPATGNLFVVDTLNHRVQVLSPLPPQQ